MKTTKELLEMFNELLKEAVDNKEDYYIAGIWACKNTVVARAMRKDCDVFDQTENYNYIWFEYNLDTEELSSALSYRPELNEDDDHQIISLYFNPRRYNNSKKKFKYLSRILEDKLKEYGAKEDEAKNFINDLHDILF